MGESNINTSVHKERKQTKKPPVKTKKATARKATTKGTTRKSTVTNRKPKATQGQRKTKNEPPKKVTSSTKSKRKPVKRRRKKKETHWTDSSYFAFYMSILGYLMFSGELLFYWFLTNEAQSFLEMFFVNLIREPYVPTMIGGMFLLPLYTYLKGTDAPFKKLTLIGFFFIVRNIAHLIFLAMV